MQKLIRKTFNGGMITDALPMIAPKDSYKYALNAVFGDRTYSNYGLSMEESNKLVCELAGKIVGVSHVDERNWSIIFLAGNDGSSGIYYYDHNKDKCELIVTDKEMGCDWCFDQCEFKYGEVKQFGACNEMTLYFSSCCTYYKINIDEMLDPVRKNAVKECRDCSYFQLFDCVCEPSLSVTKTENSGSTIETGSVQFAVKLGDGEGNFTNYSSISRTVALGSGSNTAGEISGCGATLHLTGLDPTYNRVQIAVIKKSAGITTVEELPATSYTGDGFTFDYYGQQGVPIDISDVITKSKAFIRGQDLFQKDGRMFFYNIATESNVNYQKYANNIGIKFVEYETTLEDAKRNQYPSFVRGENYAFGIVLKYCDGTKSSVFHIPWNGTETVDQAVPTLPTPDLDGNNLITEDQTYMNPNNGLYSFSQFSENDNIAPNPIPSTSLFKMVDNCCPIVIKKTNNARSIRGDQWVDNLGNQLTESPLVKNREFSAKKYESCLTYPDTKDCEGRRMFPSGNITFHRTPSNCESPMYISETSGARSVWNPVNDTFTDTRVRLLGIRLENIKLPSSEELPKPLCPNSPYEIVYVKRTDQNKSVFSKGMLTGMFKGEVYGREYLYPRHGVNSFEHVDRFITTGPNGGSRMGEQYTGHEGGHAYMFHGLDTDCDTSYLPVTHFRPELVVTGGGFRHGLYAESTLPLEDSWNNQRVDQRGARSTYSLHNHYYEPAWGEDKDRLVNIKGITYAPGNSVVTNPAGITYPLMNRFRESAVYLETDETVLEDDFDRSFVGDTLNHICGNWSKAVYGSLIRDLKDQYGTVSNLKYCSLSIHAKDIHCNGITKIEGIAGDTFITPYSKLKTSYVSNKCKDRFGVPLDFDSDSCTFRSTCDELQINDGPIAYLPQNGDERDPRNYCGLHTTEVDQVDNAGEIITPFDCDDCEPFDVLPSGVEVDGQYLFQFNYTSPSPGRACVTVNGIEYDISVPFTGQVFMGDASSYVFKFEADNGCYYETTAGPTSTTVDGEDVLFWLPFTATADCDKSEELYNEIAETHPVACDITRPCYASDPNFPQQSESDYYYPRTSTGVMQFMQESSINGCLLSSGDERSGEVDFQNLTDLGLDPTIDGGSWEDNVLTRQFYCEIRQPSRRQLWLRELYSTGLNTLNIDDSLIPIFSDLTEDQIDILLGLPRCIEDDDECVTNWRDNYCNYNPDYSPDNCLENHYGYGDTYNTCNCSSCDKTKSTNEIYHTNKQNQDSEVDAYSTVGINAYNELPSEGGNLTKLFAVGGVLMAQTTDSIYRLQEQLGSFNNNVELITGTNSLLLNPVLIGGSNSFGIGGTTHPNASMEIPQYGYFSINADAKKIYRITPQGPQEISNYGLENFFNRSLGFCKTDPNCCNCYDEKTDSGIHYSVGYDPRYKRVLFTKFDGQFSWTLSFDPQPSQGNPLGRWISFHSYIPQGYFNDQSDMFSYIGGNIYKHNIQDEYLNFYGENHVHEISFPIASDTLQCMEIRTISLLTHAERNGAKVSETFDSIAIWNDGQSTGTQPMIQNDDDFSTSLGIKDDCGMWVIDGISNGIPDTCAVDAKMTLNTGDNCEIPDDQINDDIIDCKDISGSDSKMRGRYACIKLSKSAGDNKTQLRTILVDILTDEE